MATDVKQSTVTNVESQYSPSWIDRLVEWIDGLPGPAWLFYLVCTLALALIVPPILWADGSVPVGVYDTILGIFPPFVFYFLALYHYLTRAGSYSLRAFQPLLDLDETEIARIDYRLTRLPRWAGWLSFILAAITLPQFFISGQAFGDRTPNTFLPYIVAGAAAVFFGSAVMALIIRSFRQLQMVHSLHAQATRINLFDLEPAHAFSGLTAKTGMGIILLLILGMVRDFASFQNYSIAEYILLTIAAVVVFIVPVLGIRDRLIEEKKRELRRTSELLQATIDRFENKVRANDYTDLNGLETAIGTLTRKRELIAKISTWPWDPGTVRGFASTLLLPIVLWLITHFLGRFF